MGTEAEPGKRVALVYTGPHRLTSLTVRYERYVRGFRRLGYDPITVCLPPAAEGYEPPVAIASHEAALRDPAFYHSLRCEIGVVVTWLGLPDVMRAMKAAIPWVVSVSDSDGQVGARAHPQATFTRGLHQHSAWGMQLRAAKYWAQQYLFGGGQLDADVLESAAVADRITMTSPLAVEHLRKYFHHHARPKLADKVTHTPYPVDDEFLTGNVLAAGERANRVIAIGRWDDPQKDAGLLAEGIAWAAARSPATEFVIAGRNGNVVTQRCGRIRDMGVQPPEAVADLLRTSRVLVVPSRWESGPIVAFEAVSCGASVVGSARVPACRWLERDGGCFTRRSASSLGAALVNELRAWDAGRRDSAAIATTWRKWFDPAEVCGRMLPPLGGGV